MKFYAATLVDVSPDGRCVLVSSVVRDESDLVIVRGFTLSAVTRRQRSYPARVNSRVLRLSAFVLRVVVSSRALEHQVQSRTPVLLRFLVRLPSVTATGRWRERGRTGRR
jgi:hypothetical protein